MICGHATGADSVKGKALRRDPRVCLCVDDETPPYSFVVVNGIAEITEHPEPLLEWATRIAGRYVGAERAEEYGQRNAQPGELLVRITPNHVVAQADIADCLHATLAAPGPCAGEDHTGRAVHRTLRCTRHADRPSSPGRPHRPTPLHPAGGFQSARPGRRP